MGLETHQPTLEVVIRLAGSDVCVVAAFADGVGGFDVVCGVANSDDLAQYVQLAQVALSIAADIEGWEDVSELRAVDTGGNETGAAPF